MTEVMRAASTDPDVRTLPRTHTFVSGRIGIRPAAGSALAARARHRAGTGWVWAGGFVMAPQQHQDCARSNALLDYAYGRRFRYAEYMGTGRSITAPAISL